VNTVLDALFADIANPGMTMLQNIRLWKYFEWIIDILRRF